MVDLYAGLGGWAEGGLAAGFDVVGFDIERHVYGEHRYPAQLVLQDVRTLNGSQFKDAALMVASPPCTEYSYMAMPWKRAERIAMALRGRGEFPVGYTGSRTIGKLNELFDACFRIQREASEAAGHHIPLVVENVCGAQKWVGKARWHYGSFYLWADVPALMPMTKKYLSVDGVKVGGLDWKPPDHPMHRKGQAFNPAAQGQHVRSAIKNSGGSWFAVAHNTTSGKGRNPHSSKSTARKAASALIAKIPFDLAYHIGKAWLPESAVA
jgi:hypothetical protein